MRRIALAAALVIACKSANARCAHCGMKLDPSSPWNAELVASDNTTRHFDTPRCALTTWLDEGKRGTVRVEDYYDRAMQPATALHFVIGSDVTSPMGPDLVAVDAARVAKFEKDHGGTRDITLADVDAKALAP